MKTAVKVLSTACFLAPLLLANVAVAASFSPFSDGGNVCKDCPEPKLDEVKMSNGTTLKVQVTHKNSSFYVARLHGEVRAIPVGDVSEIKWANGSEPSGLSIGGQVVLKNGHILSGEVKIDKGKYLIKISGAEKTVVAYGKVVAEVYIGGQKRKVESQ